MARVKISEYTAKKALLPAYLGVSLTSQNYVSLVRDLPRDLKNTNLVVKVDQGIKKRDKQGLVKINIATSQIPPIIKNWAKLGWSNFLVEPVVEHAPSAEHYLALERVRTGWQVSYSDKGGIEVESSWDSVKRIVLSPQGQASQVDYLDLQDLALTDFLKNLPPLLDVNHISFLEMNPIIIRGDQLLPLDMACEVDNTASSLEFLPDQTIADSERSIATLDYTTPASLKFKLLNPNGSIWVLLSGGGASLVVADEVADQGMGKNLANYGEYSGAPTDDDVYAYIKIILSQLLRSTIQHPRSIIIAGGVANFTDVTKTFKGLIRALDEQKNALVKAKVKIFVRRGGPNEVTGLKMMEDFLVKSNLLGSVHGHETALTQIVTEVKEYLS